MDENRTTTGPEAPPPEEPQGIGAEIRHEIEEAVEKVEHAVEEVVEHVPKPVRWTVGKIVMLAGLGIVGVCLLILVTAVLYIMNRTEWAAQELTLIVNQTLAKRSDVVLAIRDIKGNPLTGVRVIDPRIRYRDGTGPDLMSAPSMSLRYSALGLIWGRSRTAIDVEVDQPVFRFTRRPDGSLRVPTWNPGPPNKSRRAGFDFVVRLKNGQVLMPEHDRNVRGLQLDAFAATGKPTLVDVRNLSWEEGPYGSILRKFAGDLAVSDSVHIRVRDLDSPGLALTGRADWDRTGGPKRIRAVVRRVKWDRLAEVFRNKTLDVPGEGRFTIDASGDRSRWSGAVTAAGVWNDLPVDAHGQFAWNDGKLVIEPLDGTSPAGELDGRVAWSKAGWEVGGDTRHADPAHWKAIGVVGWPAGDLNGRFRYQVDTRAKPRSRLVAQLESTTWAGWRADSGGVIVDFPAVGPDSFRVRAIRRGGQMSLEGSADHGRWSGHYAIQRFPLDEWPDGRRTGIKGLLATGEGTVAGFEGALDVTGTLEGVRTDWFGAHMGAWRLDQVQGRLLPKPDLTAGARLEDVLFLGIHFDSTASPIHLGDGTLEFASLRGWAGDTTLSMQGRAAWDERGWSLTAQQAEMASPQFHWTVEPPLQLTGDARGVTFDRLVAADGDARVVMTGRWAVPGGSYDYMASARRLDLARLGLPDSLGLAGLADGTLRVTGVSGDPHWQLDATAARPGARGHRADSLSLGLAGSRGRLEVRDGVFLLGGGSARASGRVEGMTRDWPDTLTAGGVLAWIEDAARWQGVLSADRLPLDSLHKIVPAAKGWSGRLSGTLTIGGRPARPELVVAAEASPLGWNEVRIENVIAHATYHDERLEVQGLDMSREGVKSHANGAMPLQLALGRKPVVPDAPMSWRLDMPNADLALVPLLVSQIGAASGRLDLDARIEGTPQKPDLSGKARIRDGKISIAGREEKLENVQAVFTLDESRITLDSLTARQNSRSRVPGRVSAQGEIRFSGRGLTGYRFDLAMRDFTAIESGAYAARFDGNFVVSNGPRIRGAVVPFVTGSAEVLDAVILYDFANQSEVQRVAASTQVLYWTYSLKVNAKDNLRWRPPDADIEFSADLQLEQTPDSLIIFGEMDALRGNYYFLSNRFNVVRAHLTFDNVNGADPLVEADAVTSLVPTVVANDGQPVEIAVTITGRASRPTIEFSSSPATLDEPDILRELTLGRFDPNDPFARGAGPSVVDTWLTRKLNQQLSPELARVFRNYLTDWELARQSGNLIAGKGEVVVAFGIPVNRNLALKVRNTVPGTGGGLYTPNPNEDLFERDVQALYRLNRFFSITSEVAQKRSLTKGQVKDFNVSLKARWEY